MNGQHIPRRDRTISWIGSKVEGRDNRGSRGWGRHLVLEGNLVGSGLGVGGGKGKGKVMENIQNHQDISRGGERDIRSKEPHTPVSRRL